MSDPIQIGDFRIERQIGAGGMGIVYLATQVSLNRKVALKVLGQSLTRSSDKQRFQREAQAVAKLNHRNIAKVYYVGQDDRVCYMAMAFIEGVSLRECIERLARTKKPDSSIDDVVAAPVLEPQVERFDEPAPTADYAPTEECRERASATANPYRSPQAEDSISKEAYVRRCTEIIRDVANALQHAHDQGVIHRDLKPDNLMLDADGEVHIIDFGVAKVLEDATMTKTGALVGTPIYMSPEQVTGRMTLDARTDIYSLGLVLYEVLALRHPIRSETRDGVLRNIVIKPLQPVTRFNPRVPTPLENIVHKATAKDPDERYPSANELQKDLGRFLNGEKVTASKYRYRIDESEVRRERPTRVLAGGVLMESLSALFFFLSLVFLRGYEENPVFTVASVMMWGGLSLPLGVLGWAFMTGRYWARGCVVKLLFLIFVGYLLSAFSEPKISSIVIGVAALILLRLADGKKIRDWFDFARRVRSEEAADLD